MMTPAALERMSLYSERILPSLVAPAPRRTNTSEKPSPKNIAPKTAFMRIEVLSFFCSSSRVSPEIKDIYPGNRGRMQGDKNVRTPAINALKNEGVSIAAKNLFLKLFLYFLVLFSMLCCSLYLMSSF